MVQIPTPSLLKKPLWLKRCKLLKTVVLRLGRWFLIGAGVGIGVLHGVIVPRIDEIRPVLEQHASDWLGVPVRIGRIEAHSQRLIPSFDLHQVAILDAQGVVALQLPLIKIVVLEPLVIEKPSVDIHRDPDGTVWIAGFPIPLTSMPSDNTDSLWNWLPEVHIFEGSVTLSDQQYNVPPLVLEGLDAVLRNRDGHHIVHATTSTLQIKGNFNPRWEGVLFATTTPLPLAGLNPYTQRFGQFTQGTVALKVAVSTQPQHPVPLRVEWNLQNGTVKLPRWFEHPTLSADEWTGVLEWTKNGLRSDFQLSNTDAAAKASMRWSEKSGFYIQGRLHRANATQVHRYLPLEIPAVARHYVRDAVQGGRGTLVDFRVKGLFDDFRIAAHVENGTLAYAPQWPPLTRLTGELVIENDQLHVHTVRARVAGTSFPLEVTSAQARITDLYGSPLLTVNGEARGAVADVLETVVKQSPLGEMLNGVLNQAQATGNADYQLNLTIPLDHIDKTTVRGNVALQNNEFQILPTVPRLTHVQGTLAFTESGFAIPNTIHARSLGGSVVLEGGLDFPLGSKRLHIRGNASAEGLQLPPPIQGRTDYHASLGLEPDGLNGVVDSTLEGMAIPLPAPFGKTAEERLPLHFERHPSTTVSHEDRIAIQLGASLHATYERDTNPSPPQVLRGAIAVGLNADENAPLPEEGVLANVRLEQLNLNEWLGAITHLSATSHAKSASTHAGYMPSILGFQGREVTIGQRTFHQVVMGGTQENGTWKAQLDATEAKGTLEYQQPTSQHIGRVHARLSHLVLDAVAPAAPVAVSASPAAPLEIPPLELDVVIDDLKVYGKSLGRVEMTALNHFTLSTPEATLTAQRHSLPNHHTGMDFEVAIGDTGQLLTRFGMPDVIRSGKGKLQGQVSWMGSPMIPNWASLNGKIHLDIGSGQFLKAEPGIAKLLGVVSLQALPRRLMLDFSDVFNEGFVFDSIRGDVEIANGIATTDNLEMKGVVASATLSGQANIVEETQNLRVVVTPEINAGSASLLATTVNPIWGLGSFFAQLLLRQPFLDATTREFVIDGTWLEPNFTEISRP